MDLCKNDNINPHSVSNCCQTAASLRAFIALFHTLSSRSSNLQILASEMLLRINIVGLVNQFWMMLVNDLFLRLDLVHFSVVSMTWYKTGKPANGRGWWTYEDRQDILHQCFIWNAYMVMSALLKTDELLVHLLLWNAEAMRTSFVWFSQKWIHNLHGTTMSSWLWRWCHCFGQSKIEVASKLTLAVRLSKKTQASTETENFTHCQWFSDRNGMSHIGRPA